MTVSGPLRRAGRGALGRRGPHTGYVPYAHGTGQGRAPGPPSIQAKTA